MPRRAGRVRVPARGLARPVTSSPGRGSVTYIGAASIDGDLERDVLRRVCERAGVEAESYPPGVCVEWRDGSFVAVNYSSRPFAVPVAAGSRIVLGATSLRPAGVLIRR